jgi:hypothetical protein
MMSVAAETPDRLLQPDYHRQPSDPAWMATVVQFHGHLGPAVIAGARIGMIGLRAVEAKGYFDVEVTCEGPLAKPPQSCLLDGLQVATGATIGTPRSCRPTRRPCTNPIIAGGMSNGPGPRKWTGRGLD